MKVAMGAQQSPRWQSMGGHFVQVRELCPCGYREQGDDGAGGHDLEAAGAGLCRRCFVERPVDELAAQRAKQVIRAQHLEQWRADLAVGLWHSLADSPRSTRATP